MQLGPDTPATQTDGVDTITNPGPQSAQQGELYADDAATTQPGGVQGWLDQFRAENSMLPNILLIVGMVLIVFIVMRSLRRTTQKSRARDNALGSPSERIAEIRDQAMSSMEPGRKVMVDAEDIARRLGATLDNKAARLELLIEEADAKLDQLNRALANGPPREQHDASAGHSTHQPAPNRTLDPSLLDRARVEQDLQDRQSRVAGRIAPAPKPEVAPEPEISISDQIHDLALRGKSSKEIATELGQPIGQVELIMNLRKRSEMS